MSYKVLFHQTLLMGSANFDDLQLVATVYFGTSEYRIYAPSGAKGRVEEWIDNCLVRISNGFGEIEITGGNRLLILTHVKNARGIPVIDSRSSPGSSGGNAVSDEAADKRRVFVVEIDV